MCVTVRSLSDDLSEKGLRRRRSLFGAWLLLSLLCAALLCSASYAHAYAKHSCAALFESQLQSALRMMCICSRAAGVVVAVAVVVVTFVVVAAFA